MTQEGIYEGLKKVIERNLPRNGRSISLLMDTNLDQLGIDSARRIDILLDAEDMFGIVIEESAFAAVSTLRDLVNLVGELALAA